MYWIISVSLFLNFIFNLKLKNRFGKFRFLEIGYHLNLFLSFYIIVPTIIFISSSFTVGDPISYVFNGFTYSNETLFVKHLIRMLVFQLFFIVSYFKIRNTNIIRYKISDFNYKKAFVILFSLILVICYVLLFGLSNDFDGYLESYQRYNHLNRTLRLMVSFIVRFKFAFVVLFLIHFFIYFKNRKIVLSLGFFILLLVESKYSSGARISVLFLIFQGFGLYVIINGLPKTKNLVLASLTCLILFTVIEKTRFNNELGNDDNELISLLPGEFGAVFFTSYHLYQQREDNQLPPKSYKMFFFDFISPFVPNASIEDVDPIFWYQKAYFPESEVPPFTLGPIANTAIWEGEIGLVLRAFFCGLFLGFFSNYITKNNITLLNLFLYLSIFSTTVMVMKYSIFFHLTHTIKNLILPYLIFLILNNLFRFYSKKPQPIINEINTR